MGFLSKIFGKETRKSARPRRGQRVLRARITPRLDTSEALEIAFELMDEHTGERTPVDLPLHQHLDEQASQTLRKDPTLLSQEPIVLDLLADGLAQRSKPGQYVVPYEALRDLSTSDISGLGLRHASGWNLEIARRGTVGRSGLELLPRWTSPQGDYNVTQGGEWVQVACGLVHVRTGELAMMPRELMLACTAAQAVKEHASGDDEQYEALAFIQEQTRLYTHRMQRDGFDAPIQVKLDRQIEQERYFAPHTVKVDMRQLDDGSLELRPLVDGLEDFDAAKVLADADPSRRTIFTTDRQTNQRVRVTLPDEIHEQVNMLKRHRFIQPEDIPAFVRSPRDYLQPAQEFDALYASHAEDERLFEEALDLEQLADRIVEYDLENFGDRVIAIESGNEHIDVSRETPFGLGEGWFGEPIEHDDVVDATDAPDAELIPQEDASQIQLQTADNIEELNYVDAQTELLRSRFERLGAPKLLDGELYSYQEQGYAWLRAILDNSAERVGGLLADDMGLGKTIQIIALVCHLQETQSLSPSLFVVPKSVIPNWRRELEKFCQARLLVVEHTGSSRARSHRLLERADIILTTYQTMARDQVMLGQLNLNLLVLDEAQLIKNYTTKRACAARAMNARRRIALTATPVENNLDELWAILDFAQPGLLGTLTEFRTNFATPLERAAADNDASEDVARQLIARMDQHYLRRTKMQVLSDVLPAKHIHICELEMTALQQETYDRVRKHYSGVVGGTLACIRAMLDVCAHPFAMHEGALDALEMPRDLGKVIDDERKLVDSSAKMKWLVSQLEHIRSLGEKVIVFATQRRVQTMLRAVCEQKFGCFPAVINGDVSAQGRQDQIDAFGRQRGFDVIILSPQAAGVGLNVTAANHVIHFAREWNPAKENQATDRAYRIGQTSPVHVYLPIVMLDGRDSIDVRLHQLLESKQRLATQVIRPTTDISVKWKELEECVR